MYVLRNPDATQIATHFSRHDRATIQRDLSCQGVGPAQCRAFLRTAAQTGRTGHRRCVGCESRAAEGRRKDLTQGTERRGKRFRERNRRRAAAAYERTIMPRRRGGGRCARRARVVRARDRRECKSAIKRTYVYRAAAEPPRGRGSDREHERSRAGLRKARQESSERRGSRMSDWRKTSPTQSVMVVDAPLVFCGALEGDAAHELILIA